MTDMSEIARLLTIEEIKLLKARHDRAFDTKDWDTYLELHSSDYMSRDDSGAAYISTAEMMAGVRKVLDAAQATVHHSHTPEISLESPITAKGIWAVEISVFWKQDDEDHWLDQFGFIHETYRRHDNAWLFASRQFKRTHTRVSPGAHSDLVAEAQAF